MGSRRAEAFYHIPVAFHCNCGSMPIIIYNEINGVNMGSEEGNLYDDGRRKKE
jgi:hypothetical protein